ncbi:hypothetical protein PanWU01x14_109520 [Parasponia andersonii]|uniref:Uncharacterized protein n=1 Tax=Parasponia andersonii TaxID=3476 RepID=A0A2P5CZQ0_PARAD|nr:hypothetical protein PanWU01x14_109520 [Parasponia andersonii]
MESNLYALFEKLHVKGVIESKGLKSHLEKVATEYSEAPLEKKIIRREMDCFILLYKAKSDGGGDDNMKFIGFDFYTYNLGLFEWEECVRHGACQFAKG